MNVKLLKRVKAAILAHPTQVNMADWTTPIPAFERLEIKGCGTAGCIAGWVVFLEKKAKGELATLAQLDVLIPDCDYPELAEKALDIDYYERKRLFLISEWPPEFADKLSRAKTPKRYAQVVADRIDFFIKNKV